MSISRRSHKLIKPEMPRPDPLLARRARKTRSTARGNGDAPISFHSRRREDHVRCRFGILGRCGSRMRRPSERSAQAYHPAEIRECPNGGATLREDGPKSGLLEMVVRRQGVGQPTFRHDSERDAVRQGPGFVRAGGEQVEAGLVHGRDVPYDIK